LPEDYVIANFLYKCPASRVRSFLRQHGFLVFVLFSDVRCEMSVGHMTRSPELGRCTGRKDRRQKDTKTDNVQLSLLSMQDCGYRSDGIWFGNLWKV